MQQSNPTKYNTHNILTNNITRVTNPPPPRRKILPTVSPCIVVIEIVAYCNQPPILICDGFSFFLISKSLYSHRDELIIIDSSHLTFKLWARVF